jgi:hypothetical protein
LIKALSATAAPGYARTGYSAAIAVARALPRTTPLPVRTIGELTDDAADELASRPTAPMAPRVSAATAAHTPASRLERTILMI